MRKNAWFWVTLVLAAAALVASAALLVDYLRPAPVFCDVEGPCGRVRATIFARPFGIPMPAIGIAGILGIALAALVPGRRARWAQVGLAGAGALVAVVLFVVQWLIGALCPFCAVVDASALGLCAAAVVRLRGGLDPPVSRAIPAVPVAGLLLFIGAPLLVGFQRHPMPVISADLPPSILEEIRRTGRGKITVVDFVDFECPFCRMTHTELAPLLEKRKDKVRVTRRHVPLRMHPHAMDAAKAGCCGESLGRGDEMADALFTAPPEELTPEGCEKLAQELHLDLDRFRACVRDPATDARIEKDREAFRAAKGHGLPTIWVGGTRLEGAQDRATLEATLDDAIRAL
jgi:uncharacterized membrane protein